MTVCQSQTTELSIAGLHVDAVAIDDRGAAWPGAPFVAPALLKTAVIEERLSHPEAARQLYQQVAAAFDGTPAAASAKASISRLSRK